MYICISNKYKVLGQNFERPVKMIGITDSFFLLCCSEQTCRQKYICVYVYCIYVYIYTYVLFFVILCARRSEDFQSFFGTDFSFSIYSIIISISYISYFASISSCL